VSAYVYRGGGFAAMQTGARKTIPNVATKVVGIHKRPPLSVSPAFQQKRYPDFETAARIARCSPADAGGRTAFRQQL